MNTITHIDGIPVDEITSGRLTKAIKWLEMTERQYEQNMELFPSLEGSLERIRSRIESHKALFKEKFENKKKRSNK